MTCSQQLWDAFPLGGDAEIWVRYLAGHRVISESHLADVREYISTSFDRDAPWIEYLADGWPIPTFGSTYTVVEGDRDVEGTLRVRLTPDGVAAVDDWLHGGCVDAPLAGDNEWLKPIILQLWGAGAGIPAGHWARTAKARRGTLATFFGNSHERAACFVQSNDTAVEIRDLNRRLAALADRDDALDLGLPGEAFDARRTSLIISAQDALERSPIEVTRRARTKTGLGRFLVLEAAGWSRPRRSIKESGEPVSDAEAQSTYLIDLEYIASRSSNRHSVAPTVPFSVHKRAELASLKVTQGVIGSIMRAHPAKVESSATLWVIKPVHVYVDEAHHAGLPSALDIVSPLGAEHPMIRSTQRIIDGVVFTSSDQPLRPRIWIEHEAGRSNPRVRHHLAAALSSSSRWGQKIDLIIVTSSAARNVVEQETHEFLDSRYFRRSGENEFPGGAVDLHIVSEHAAQSGCPLHGAVHLRNQLRVPGDNWRIHAILNDCLPRDIYDLSRSMG